MEPTTEQRLQRMREVLDGGMRYYATAYLNTPAEREHLIPERDLLRSHMRHYAAVMASLEGDAPDDRSMMRIRHQIVERYVQAARADPWSPPVGG
jgi:hypothetical protein